MPVCPIQKCASPLSDAVDALTPESADRQGRKSAPPGLGSAARMLDMSSFDGLQVGS
jgi:hypothetical protein